MRGAENHSVIEALREQIRSLEGGRSHRRAVLPFGVDELDRRLPQGGLMLGALHEVAGGGSGALDGAAAALFILMILHRASDLRNVDIDGWEDRITDLEDVIWPLEESR